MKKALIVGLMMLAGIASAQQQNARQINVDVLERGIWKEYKEECGGGSIVKAYFLGRFGLVEASRAEQQKLSNDNENCQAITQFMLANNIPFPPKK